MHNALRPSDVRLAAGNPNWTTQGQTQFRLQKRVITNFTDYRNLQVAAV